MDYEELWAPINEAPVYAVSTYGRVMNTHTERLRLFACNQQGIPSVLLSKDGKPFRRSVSKLVVNAFLPRPDEEAFDTPINIDGNRLNNFLHNLVWRPRWFAVEYHQQFNYSFPNTSKVQDIQTRQTFDNAWVCAKTFGLLFKDVHSSIMNEWPVFPTWQKFTYVA